MIIVYQSNCGHTKRYAKMLANRINGTAYTVKEYKKKNMSQNQSIIFLGSIMAGMVEGYKSMKHKANIVACLGVGATLNSEKNTNAIMNNNKIKEQFFYLEGGFDIDKVKGIKKILMKQMVKALKKKEITDENRDMISVMVENKDLVRESELDSIYDYLSLKGLI